MGHLVNATAMRLGWFSNWADSWFAEHIYYSEYLFIMFRIRFFLILVLHSHDMEEMGFFYSHFEFLYKVNSLYIDIYLYDGPLESDIEFFFFDNTLILRRLRQQYKGKIYLNTMWFRVWKIFIVIAFLNYFTTSLWTELRVRNLIKAIYNLRLHTFLKFHKKPRYKFTSIGRRQRLNMLIFFLLLRDLKSLVDPHFIHVNVSRHIYMTRLLFAGFYASWRNFILRGLKYYVTYVMNMLIPFHKNIVNIYYITSYAVTAKFLSRYIARKLHQNYRMAELLYPIKRELNYVMSLVTYPLSRYFFKIKSNNWRIHTIWLFRGSVFKYILGFLVNLYNRYFANFNKFSNSWFSFDMVLLYNSLLKNMKLLKDFFGLNRKFVKSIYFSRSFFNYSYNFKLLNLNFILITHKQNVLSNLKAKFNNSLFSLFIKKYLSLFKFCYYYIYNRQTFVYLYDNNSKELNLYLKSYFKPHTLFHFEHNYKFYNYVEFIFNNLYVNFNNLIFWKNNFIFNFKYLLHSNKYLNRFLKYNYWTYNMNWLFAYLNINKLKVRLGRAPTSRYLLGFKFHCLGRFTRRQRAISKWVDAYKMPLNTLSAFIDYGFFTIPLRNSAIAVKVWLYKEKDYNEYFLKAD